MNSYELSRSFCDWSFENPQKIKPIHYAIYFFAVEHCNRLGWKTNFGLPSQMVMEAIGVKNWRTYSSGLNDLVDFGFIKMIEISKNQYSSNIIALVKNTKAPTKALDKALSKHSTKQSQSAVQGTVSIDKPYNKEQYNKEQKTNFFNEFWSLYPNKTGKQNALNKFLDLDNESIDTILNTVEKYSKHSQFEGYNHPMASTYINQKRWLDEIPEPVTGYVFDIDNPPPVEDIKDYLDWQERRRQILLKTF